MGKKHISSQYHYYLKWLQVYPGGFQEILQKKIFKVIQQVLIQCVVSSYGSNGSHKGGTYQRLC